MYENVFSWYPKPVHYVFQNFLIRLYQNLYLWAFFLSVASTSYI